MKKLVLLLTALLVLSTLVSSPVLAARPSFEYRIHSMFGFLWRSMMIARGAVIVPEEEITPINTGGGAGGCLGGDADDYGNGRGDDGIINENKPVNRLIGDGWLGPDAQGSGATKSV